MATERQAGIPAQHGSDSAEAIFRKPPGDRALPRFDHGWLIPDRPRAAFLSYAEADPSVNWSEELEQLHEESSRTHFLDRWTRTAITERIGPTPTAPTIADLGCSTGFLLQDLRVAYPAATLVGVDLISGGLEKAHRLVPSARLIRADVGDLPISDASVDAVVSANLLEHVPDDSAALREFARVLRPGARAVIVVPAGPSTYDYYDSFLGHERRYGHGELSRKCAAANLEIVEDSYIGSLLYPAFWLVKQRNRRSHLALQDDGLESRVASDINRTHGSRVGVLAWRLEGRLAGRGLRFPFGIRSLVVARRPGSDT